MSLTRENREKIERIEAEFGSKKNEKRKKEKENWSTLITPCHRSESIPPPLLLAFFYREKP